MHGSSYQISFPLEDVLNLVPTDAQITNLLNFIMSNQTEI